MTSTLPGIDGEPAPAAGARTDPTAAAAAAGATASAPPRLASAALVYGFWGQNVGNAFFNLGGDYILRSRFPNVYRVQDAPGYWTLRSKRRGNHRNWFPVPEHVDAEWLFLQGPLLHADSLTIWESVLPALRRRGVRIGLLGAGLRTYTAGDVAAARTLVQRFGVELVSTRDEPTADALAGLDIALHSGLDSAFWVADAVRVAPLVERFCVFNLDQLPDPYTAPATARVPWSMRDARAIRVTVDGDDWKLSFPFPYREARRLGQAAAYATSVLHPRRHAATHLGAYTIVRTDHRTNPHLPFRIYGLPNGVASDEPYTYLTLYANARFVVSDRVHACVAAASFGTPCRFVGRTPRAALLEQAGLRLHDDGFLRVAPGELARRKAEEIAFLERALGAAG